MESGAYTAGGDRVSGAVLGRISGPRISNRLTTAFRIIVAIPIVIVLAAMAATTGRVAGAAAMAPSFAAGGSGASLLPDVADDRVSPEIPALVVRLQPRAAAVPKSGSGSISACWTTATRRRTSGSPSRSSFAYPDAKQGLNRWLPLVKWFLAIPHYIVLFFLILAAIVCVIIAWFAILFTGRYPRGLFDFVVGRQALVQSGQRLRVRPGDGQVPAFQPQPLEERQGRADSARRASSSILPCAASSLPTHVL